MDEDDFKKQPVSKLRNNFDFFFFLLLFWLQTNLHFNVLIRTQLEHSKI